ncbi:MAG: peroxiredoxin family protein [Ktedonobacterales bacterium]
MRLAIGQMAPPFVTEDLFGRSVALQNYRGAYVLLSFYRFAVCPVCNVRMHRLAQQAEAYKRRGLYFIACIESSPENAHFYLDRVNYPFPLVPDLGGGLYEAYGVGSSVFGVVKGMVTRQRDYREAAHLNLGGWNVRRFDGKFGRMPADFLIGSDGRVVLAYYGHDHGDFLKLEELTMLLQYRQPVTPPPHWTDHERRSGPMLYSPPPGFSEAGAPEQLQPQPDARFAQREMPPWRDAPQPQAPQAPVSGWGRGQTR